MLICYFHDRCGFGHSQKTGCHVLFKKKKRIVRQICLTNLCNKYITINLVVKPVCDRTESSAYRVIGMTQFN